MAARRRSGQSVRTIAQAMGRSRSGVQGVLARLGLAGRPWPRTRRPVVLSRRAEASVGLLLHPQARGLTWRQQAVLWGQVRGDPPARIAAHLGIRPDSIRWHVQAARQRLARLGLGCQPVRRRRPGADLAVLPAALG
jgi:DNA-binding NarL/FixJ family response regulator